MGIAGVRVLTTGPGDGNFWCAWFVLWWVWGLNAQVIMI